MKKIAHLLPLLLLAATGTAALAQTAPKIAHSPTTAKSSVDYCLMKDGKMTLMKGGKMVPLTANMTMSDGSMCMTDGTCKTKDGTIKRLKEGECMMMDGRMTMHPGSIKRPPMKTGDKMGDMKM
ncbi:MAG: hypothetical protein M3Y54_21310 [Bacteroidota bacterium]|jgi:hypothetical protein|nr:hypothetical protein [Bacteroidota bacterium]